MSRSPWVWVTALAAAAGAVWIPFMARSLSPDEGGLLMLAAQWSPGSSLYGDYFVDRPPLLVTIFALADAAGGAAWTVRTAGIVAVVLSVLLAGTLGRLAAADPTSRLAPVLPAATAAILVTTPLFGSTVVNGELLGLPFLLAGLVAAVAAARSPRPGAAVTWGLLAGAMGACAALVKQSLLDVFVFVLVLLVPRRRFREALAVLAGAAAVTALATWASYLRGTDPRDLWDAVVVFRRQAAAVIAESASDATPQRFAGMLLALVASGAPFLAVVLARRLRERAPTPDLRWPAAAVLAWELMVVLVGGSYWLHYLIGLVPGMVLLAAAAAQRPLRTDRALRVAYGVAAASTVVALTWALTNPTERPERPAVAWLDEHARPGDTAVVAFGGANILRSTGLRSPYPDLWSLPVRVHDPDLSDLSTLLASSDRPTWLIVAGRSLDTWGVDATVADRYLRDHYTRATTAGRWTIYRSDLP